MRYTRVLSSAAAAALAVGLAACTTYSPDYPILGVNDSHPNAGGTSVFEPTPATYVPPGTTYGAAAGTTYVVPPGSTTTYVAPGTTVVVPAGSSTVAQAQTYAVPSVEYGRITNVALVSPGTSASGANAAAGTIAGGLVGGALGSMVGGGAGRVAATILGAVTGAAVGNNLATRPYNNYAGAVYRVWVQTDSGAIRAYDVAANANLHAGDRVRIENGAIYMG